MIFRFASLDCAGDGLASDGRTNTGKQEENARRETEGAKVIKEHKLSQKKKRKEKKLSRD